MCSDCVCSEIKGAGGMGPGRCRGVRFLGAVDAAAASSGEPCLGVSVCNLSAAAEVMREGKGPHEGCNLQSAVWPLVAAPEAPSVYLQLICSSTYLKTSQDSPLLPPCCGPVQEGQPRYARWAGT